MGEDEDIVLGALHDLNVQKVDRQGRHRAEKGFAWRINVGELIGVFRNPRLDIVLDGVFLLHASIVSPIGLGCWDDKMDLGRARGSKKRSFVFYLEIGKHVFVFIQGVAVCAASRALLWITDVDDLFYFGGGLCIIFLRLGGALEEVEDAHRCVVVVVVFLLVCVSLSEFALLAVFFLCLLKYIFI